MKITESDEVESVYKDDKTGEAKKQIRVTWEIVRVTPDQEEAGAFVGHQVKQWMPPFAGYRQDGSLSWLGQIVKPSIDNGELEGEWSEKDLVGMTRRVSLSVEQKIDKHGNEQQFNRVTGIAPLGKTQQSQPVQSVALPRDTVSAAQATTRTRVNLADADDIAGLQLPDDLKDLDGLTLKDLREYAATLAPEAGGFYLKQNWQTIKTTDLLRLIGAMRRYLNRHPADEDENKDLFE